MAIDVERMKQVFGMWFPKEDTECSAVVFGELAKLKQLPYDGKNVAVQAGGNAGVFPIALSMLFEEVYTFEPDPLNYECMLINIDRLNAPNVKHMQAGLSVVEGRGNMVGDHVNCGALQIEEASDGDVKLVTIDSLELPECDLIYLDIEGFEDLALMGATETIAMYKPVIVCENKGHNDRFPADLDGSEEFREFVCNTFGYEVFGRLMRDDVFVCK